ncbi:MAG: CPBP family intramembrane metalloprotease [Oscillospiraceae bacterium]|nr:CPBP family intramembrane metalloprotease [Oscillospiraceae bacterium]
MELPTEEKLLDVVEEFTVPQQSEAYQASYRRWRRRKNNRYAFCFSKNMKEATFAENQAVVNETPAQAENSALHSLGILFAWALMLYLVIENVIDKIVVLIAQYMGVRIEMVYWGESRYYGEDQVVFLFTAALQILKILVPILVIGLALRMSLRTSVPCRVRNKRYFLTGVSAVMLLSVVLGIAFVSRSAELEKYRLISEVNRSEDHWVIIYILFTVFIAPLFSELLFHGAMFQSLRQFGDRFAIGAVAILSALLAHNPHDALRLGLLTLLISFFMVRTGSFLTAVIMRIIHEIYMFAMFQIESYGGMFSVYWWFVVLFPVVVGLLNVVAIVLNRGEKEEYRAENPSYMTIWDQATAFFTSIPMLIMLVTCVLLIVVTFMLG